MSEQPDQWTQVVDPPIQAEKDNEAYTNVDNLLYEAIASIHSADPSAIRKSVNDLAKGTTSFMRKQDAAAASAAIKTSGRSAAAAFEQQDAAAIDDVLRDLVLSAKKADELNQIWRSMRPVKTPKSVASKAIPSTARAPRRLPTLADALNLNFKASVGHSKPLGRLPRLEDPPVPGLISAFQPSPKENTNTLPASVGTKGLPKRPASAKAMSQPERLEHDRLRRELQNIKTKQNMHEAEMHHLKTHRGLPLEIQRLELQHAAQPDTIKAIQAQIRQLKQGKKL